MVSLTPLSTGPALSAPDLLQLPRPGTASPNPSGTRALWPASAFSFDAAGGAGRTAKSVYLVDLPKVADAAADGTAGKASGGIKEVLSNLVYSEAVWLDDNNFLFLRPPYVKGGEEGVSEGDRVDHPVEVSDKDNKARVAKAAGEEGGEGVELWAHDLADGEDYLITKLPVVVSNLKTVQINSSKEQGAIVSFSAQVFPDGDINKVLSHTKQLEKDQAGSDVLVYDSTFARHWDSWSPTAGQKTQLFFVRLTRNPESFVTSSDDDYDAVSRAELPGPNAHAKWSVLTEAGPAGVAAEATRRVAIQAPLAGTPLECPVGPFGDASDFTLSSTHLAFHAKDPLVNPAWHTRTNVYLVPLSPKSKADAEPRAVTIGTQGATASPVFSPDGARLAWLEMREDGYEADRNRVMVYEVKTGLRWGVTESFDRSPGHLEWSPDGKKLFFTAEDDARVKLFEVAVPVPKDDATVAEAEAAAKAEPVTLTHHHSVTGFSPLSPTSVLLTTNSLTRPNELSLVSFAKSKGDDYAAPSDVTHSLLSTLTSGLGDKKELDEGESFYFKGAEGVQIQGWILFPPGLRDPATRKGKKLPLAFLVHGGPEGAWTDSWSTRWAPNIYASAGYITVAINPTGSTGFGEALTRGIRGQWGGRPFQDLVAGLDYVKETYPEIDGDRMAMLGASYGGYMANWIQGHNNATKFKAIVCHDGVFNTASTWFTGDELFFPEAEALATGSATPWEDKEAYDKWSPHNHIANFGTPELIIHSSRDYRLVEGEGLAMFNTLQRLGVPSRFVVFPSENHWVLSPHNSVKWHEQVLGWIGEWTAEGK